MDYRTTKSKIKVENNKANNYTEFYYYFFRNILLVGIPLVIISAIILSSLHSSATGSTSGSDNLAITISSSCTLGSVVNIPHSKEVYNGNYETNIGKTTITTLCNDGNGYSIYANGYSNNEEGNNKLINSEYPEYSINTGLATSGLTSAWAMKLNNIPDDPSPTPPVIEQDYNNTYGIVPTLWTKVAGRQSGTTDMSQGSSFTTTYSVYASSSQYAGTYQGQVKYILVHPSSPFKNLTMQSIATWKDIALPNEGDSTQAVDERDGKSYWVTRLADGNIWMTQNLDIDINSSIDFNSTNTDLNVVYNSTTGQYAEYNSGYSQVNDIIYWQPLRGTISFKGTTVSGWQDSYTEPYSANKTDDTNTGHASLGNHYNWTVAIASNNSANASAQNYVTENSICPKGWRLPKTSPYNEFSTLANAYNITTSTNAINLSNPPLYFTRPGFIDYSIYTSNNVGYYWSSTVYNGTDAYRLDFGNNRLDWNSRLKNFGFSVRCVAR